MKDKLFI